MRRLFENLFGPRALPDDVVSIDFVDLFRFLAGYVHMFALVGIIGAAAGFALSYSKDRVYRSEIVVSVVRGSEGGGLLSGLSGSFGGLAALAGVNLGSGGDREEILAVLRSRALFDSFVRQENVLPVLFHEEWDTARASWKPMSQDEVPTLADAYKKLTEDVFGVVENRRTGLITISVEWRDRELAATWARRLIEIANAQIRQRAIDEADRSVEFLGAELERNTAIEVRDSIYRLLEAQFNKRMMANVREEYALKVIDPPSVADADRPVRPRRVLMAVIGGFAGDLVLGFWLTLALALRMRSARLGRKA